MPGALKCWMMEHPESQASEVPDICSAVHSLTETERELAFKGLHSTALALNNKNPYNHISVEKSPLRVHAAFTKKTHCHHDSSTHSRATKVHH